MSLKLNSSGGGSVTLQEPVTASTLTLNLPAFSGTAATLASVTNNGVLYVNSSGQPTSGSALTFDGTNFGVGTTSPAVKFVASNGGANGIELAVVGFSGDNAIQSYNRSGAAYTSLVYNALNHRFATSGTEQMRLDASGNLKLGTTGFGTRAAIYGTNAGTGTTVSGSEAAMLLLVDSSAAANAGPEIAFASCYANDNGGTITGAAIKSYKVPGPGSDAGQYNHGLIFKTSVWPTGVREVARLDPDGNLLVGLTVAQGQVLGAQIRAAGDIWSGMSASTNATSTLNVYSTGAAAYRFYVGMAGTVYATSTTITAISDQRLKENIRDLDDGLDVVMALKPRKFDWKEGRGENIKNARGFIAQEFEQVLPDMIHEWRDAAPEGEDPYKAVNANLIPTLVKAIQEQQAIIKSLKARLDAANL